MELGRSRAGQGARHPRCMFPGWASPELYLGLCFLKITDLEAICKRLEENSRSISNYTKNQPCPSSSGDICCRHSIDMEYMEEE